MQTAPRSDYVTVEEYLASEAVSEVRHEYLGGLVYAMAGKTRDHNQIVQNLAYSLRSHLQGGPCKIYLSDIRVNFELHDDEYYYYPDIVVTCDKRDTHARFVRYPRLIIEVLSESTERIDRREKFFAYTSIASLDEYVLVSQAAREVTVFRRALAWKMQTVPLEGDHTALVLESLHVTIPFSTIYEGI